MASVCQRFDNSSTINVKRIARMNSVQSLRFRSAVIRLLFMTAIAVFWGSPARANELMTQRSAQISSPTRSSILSPKIRFDSSHLSEQGLMGQPGGWRSLSYEFCIPATPQAVADIRAIDPTLSYSRSPGRIGCRQNQYLVIGHTHHPHWRKRLTRLANLPYVERIDPFFGE